MSLASIASLFSPVNHSELHQYLLDTVPWYGKHGELEYRNERGAKVLTFGRQEIHFQEDGSRIKKRKYSPEPVKPYLRFECNTRLGRDAVDFHIEMMESILNFCSERDIQVLMNSDFQDFWWPPEITINILKNG